MRRTKIVATIGPSTDSVEMIEALIKEGVNVFRFNFSHATHEYHEANFNKIREIAKKLGTYTAILADIAGPKIRVGHIENEMHLKDGDTLYFYKKEIVAGDNKLNINHPSILEDVKIGEPIYLADGTIRVEVTDITTDFVATRVLVGGKLTSRKGVNFPGSKLNISPITEKDKMDIEFCCKLGVDFFALSFIMSRDNILEAKELVKGFGATIPVFAKIEKTEAVANIDSILEVVDGIMVARGDLGVEFGLHLVPTTQKMIIKKANDSHIPVITATQMLTSMINSPFPTRAEVSDIANAVLDGTDAVMLSDETTVGHYPLEVIQMINKTLFEVEKIYPYYRDIDHPDGCYEHAIAISADKLAQSVDAEAVIVFTISGASAQTTSKYRPKSRIIANSDNEVTLRKLSIVWGVEPGFVISSHSNSDRIVYEFVKSAVDSNLIDVTKNYVITLGHPTGATGTSNLIRLLNPSSVKHILELF